MKDPHVFNFITHLFGVCFITGVIITIILVAAHKLIDDENKKEEISIWIKKFIAPFILISLVFILVLIVSKYYN